MSALKVDSVPKPQWITVVYLDTYFAPTPQRGRTVLKSHPAVACELHTF